LTNQEDIQPLHDLAYGAIEGGALAEASRHFDALLQRHPDDRYYHYMRGLAHKYMLDWSASLHHNLSAIELAEEFGESEHWNAAIAATALGDWERARALWAACGIGIAEGCGPIVDNFGLAVVRLNPWHSGETVWARRIDPVRARLLNVPLPESGHRFGDIVLHDGAPTGTRWDGERKVSVFNALQRLEPSDFMTHAVFVTCDRSEDLLALREATAPGIGYIEDWTGSVRYHCMRCSYGAPHTHDAPVAEGDWVRERNLGIAAQGRKPVEKLLREWERGSRGRRVDSVETREHAIPERSDGRVWWREPEPDPAA
jgi:hypothetical protein